MGILKPGIRLTIDNLPRCKREIDVNRILNLYKVFITQNHRSGDEVGKTATKFGLSRAEDPRLIFSFPAAFS